MRLFFSFSHRDIFEIDMLIRQIQIIDDEIQVKRIEGLHAGSEIRSSIVSEIRSADAVVALFSGRSESVFFEAGIATGMGKPLIAITHDASFVPTDLQNVPFVKLLGDVHQDAVNLLRTLSQFDLGERRTLDQFPTAEAKLKACIENSSLLEAMSPEVFESTIENYFSEKGFELDDKFGSNSKEIDFVARRLSDHLSILVETKKLSAHTKVSSDTVERVAGSLPSFGAVAGLIISSSGFTRSALALASKYGILLKNIEDLLTSDGLRDFMRK